MRLAVSVDYLMLAGIEQTVPRRSRLSERGSLSLLQAPWPLAIRVSNACRSAGKVMVHTNMMQTVIAIRMHKEASVRHDDGDSDAQEADACALMMMQTVIAILMHKEAGVRHDDASGDGGSGVQAANVGGDVVDTISDNVGKDDVDEVGVVTLAVEAYCLPV